MRLAKAKRAKDATTRSSEEERMEHAWALGAEEGRDKLRKACLLYTSVSISGDTLTMNATRMASENYSDIKNFKYMDDVIVPTKLPSGLMLNEIVDSDGVSLTLVYTYADNSNEYISCLLYTSMYPRLC